MRERKYRFSPSWLDGFTAGVSYILCARMVQEGHYGYAVVWLFFGVWWTRKEWRKEKRR